ncbi:MAG TPA: hypothetical protein VKA30_11330 [Actinomycetota bacterium]|nr:hypothetical protein [Actinomycetota bacterium]
MVHEAMSSLVPLAFKLSPFFVKGVLVTICAFILFVGSVYVLLAAVFGLRMAYLVTAVSFFGWMIIFSLVWLFGSPFSTPPDQGPRGYEPHWQVFAAGTGSVGSQYDPTKVYPSSPWRDPSGEQTAEVDTVKAVIQKYLAARAAEDLKKQGVKECAEEAINTTNCFNLDPTTFTIQDVKFTTDGKTDLVGAHAFYAPGATQVAVFAYFDKGNVPKYSIAFLGASIFGFLIHLPFLDRAERKRKEILTGGTAPPWFGPA